MGGGLGGVEHCASASRSIKLRGGLGKEGGESNWGIKEGLQPSKGVEEWHWGLCNKDMGRLAK